MFAYKVYKGVTIYGSDELQQMEIYNGQFYVGDEMLHAYTLDEAYAIIDILLNGDTESEEIDDESKMV